MGRLGSLLLIAAGWYAFGILFPETPTHCKHRFKQGKEEKKARRQFCCRYKGAIAELGMLI